MSSVTAPTYGLNDSVVDGLCRLVSVAETQAPMAYCKWEHTRLK